VPQTFVWNWYWNCTTDEATPSVPAPPAGATTIVLNWHWACADAPPALDVAGVTVCTSCNIAISVRVGSPGNTGDLAQTIASQTAAAAANLAETIQTALQAIPPASTPSPGTTSASEPPVTAPTIAAASSPQLRAYPTDAGIFVAPPSDASVEDPPRHGAPPSFGVAAGPQRYAVSAAAVSMAAPLAAAGARGVYLQRWLLRRAVEPGRRSVRSSAAGARRPVPVPVPTAPPPSAPTPFVLAAGALSTHGGGPGAVAAIASALALAFLYAVYSALRAPPAVPPARASGAKPHPPG